jgi:hypothetical protein
MVDSLIRVERVAASDDDYEEEEMTGVEANQRAQGKRGSGGRP